MKVCEKEGNDSPTPSPSVELQDEKAIITNGNILARFSATNDVQSKDCRYLGRYTSRRSRVSAAVKAAMLLQRDCALSAVGRRLRYENSTTMQQRGAGNTIRVCTFFVRSVRATSMQVYNRSTTATRPLRGSTTAAQPCYHRTSALKLQRSAAARRRSFAARPSRQRACDAVA